MAKEKKDLVAMTSKTKSNKLRKIEKHVKKHPEDEAAKLKLKGLQSGADQFFPRKKPTNKNGWVNSMLTSKKLSSNKLENLKTKLRPEKRKHELMAIAQYLKAESV